MQVSGGVLRRRKSQESHCEIRRADYCSAHSADNDGAASSALIVRFRGFCFFRIGFWFFSQFVNLRRQIQLHCGQHLGIAGFLLVPVREIPPADRLYAGVFPEFRFALFSLPCRTGQGLFRGFLRFCGFLLPRGADGNLRLRLLRGFRLRLGLLLRL